MTVERPSWRDDYWVCQALSAVATNFPDDVVFKGGTSIEKLRLIERLSEDIDLLVVARLANDREGVRLLKDVCANVAEALGQTTPEKIIGGGKAATATLFRNYLDLGHRGDSSISVIEHAIYQLDLGHDERVLPSTSTSFVAASSGLVSRSHR